MCVCIFEINISFIDKQRLWTARINAHDNSTRISYLMHCFVRSLVLMASEPITMSRASVAERRTSVKDRDEVLE